MESCEPRAASGELRQFLGRDARVTVSCPEAIAFRVGDDSHRLRSTTIRAGNATFGAGDVTFRAEDTAIGAGNATFRPGDAAFLGGDAAF